MDFCVGNSPLTGEFPAQSPVTQFWYFLWSAPELVVEQKNGDAGDLRRHRANYDVIVMLCGKQLLLIHILTSTMI